MDDLKNSFRYNFYLKFNLVSTWLVVLLPFVLLAIYFIFDIQPDVCDSVNSFLIFFTFFALMIFNISQSGRIVNKEDSDEES